jgi:hypothetical protein
MKPEGSLPWSQDPATGPYPESDESSPHHHTVFIYLFIYSFILMLFCHLHLALPHIFFSTSFLTKICKDMLSPSRILHALSI